MQCEPVKARLRAGEPVLGCWLWLFSPMAAEITAQAGYDFVMIDREHGPGSVLDSLPLIQAVEGNGCGAMMRLPCDDPVEIKRTLDIGVSGVMIPCVDTAKQAAAVVSACRYPPKGQRGMAAMVIRAAGYGADWQDYVRRVDEELLVICQIESREGVDNVEEIAAVEGVDLLFIGPFDLSANLGFLGQPDHPEVRAEIEKVERAAQAAGKALGCIATPERDEADLLAAGYRFLLCDGDSLLLRDAARKSVARQRKLLAQGTV